MKLEEELVSLELSRELKETGYPQEGLWWWTDWRGGYAKGHPSYKKTLKWVIGNEDRARHFENAIVAPTVAELGMALDYYTKSYQGTTGNWYVDWFNEERTRAEFANTEADARAKMWLYLKKEGLC